MNFLCSCLDSLSLHNKAYLLERLATAFACFSLQQEENRRLNISPFQQLLKVKVARKSTYDTTVHVTSAG